MAIGEAEKRRAAHLSAQDCYDRIRSWLTTGTGMQVGNDRFRQIASAIPSWDKATLADKCFVFSHVIVNKLESAHWKEDTRSEPPIHIAAYGYRGLDVLGYPFDQGRPGDAEAEKSALNSI